MTKNSIWVLQLETTFAQNVAMFYMKQNTENGLKKMVNKKRLSSNLNAVSTNQPAGSITWSQSPQRTFKPGFPHTFTWQPGQLYLVFSLPVRLVVFPGSGFPGFPTDPPAPVNNPLITSPSQDTNGSLYSSGIA